MLTFLGAVGFFFFVLARVPVNARRDPTGRAWMPRLGRGRRRGVRARSRGRRGSSRKDVDVGLLVSEVATRLRSGAHAPAAWAQALDRVGVDAGNEGVVDTVGVPYALRRMGQERRASADTKAGIAAAVAVCRMGQVTGAPTADVFDSCAAGITEAAESAAERRVALAGARTSARMLSALPVLGILLGVALGAQPLSFLTGTAVGRVCLAMGMVAEGLGLYWIRRLTARARAQGMTA